MDAVRYDRVGNVAVLTVEYVLYRRGRVPDGAGRHPRADSPGGRGVRHAHTPDCDARHERARRRHDGARDAQGDPAGGRAVFPKPAATRRARAAGHEIRTGLLSLRGTAEVPRSRDNADHRGRRTRTRHRAADEEIEFRLFAPWSTRARRNWRTVPRFAPAISMSLGSTDMVSPRTRAVPCSGVRESGSIASTRRPWKQRSATVPAGARASCSSGSHVKVGAGRMPDGRSLFTFLNRLSRR